jgi:hypothetical protein
MIISTFTGLAIYCMRVLILGGGLSIHPTLQDEGEVFHTNHTTIYIKQKTYSVSPTTAKRQTQER